MQELSQTKSRRIVWLLIALLVPLSPPTTALAGIFLGTEGAPLNLWQSTPNSPGLQAFYGNASLGYNLSTERLFTVGLTYTSTLENLSAPNANGYYWSSDDVTVFLRGPLIPAWHFDWKLDYGTSAVIYKVAQANSQSFNTPVAAIQTCWRYPFSNDFFIAPCLQVRHYTFELEADNEGHQKTMTLPTFGFGFSN